MSSVKKILSIEGNSTINEAIFSLIAQDIKNKGYGIRPGALPEELSNSLFFHQQAMAAEKFTKAGIGRGDEYLKNDFV